MIDIFELVHELKKRHGMYVKIHAEYDYTAIWGNPVLCIYATWKTDGREFVCQWALTPEEGMKATAKSLVAELDAPTEAGNNAG